MFDPDSKSMRPTMPYRRIKPEYTPTAFLYEIAATVEAEVSIDEKGEIRRIDVVRWAGYGLDEAVISAIRQMNWRPGERSGKPLPMRVLLRYNFTKIDKE
jgi:TonB family protein